jgi:magnesium-transporting ATPase (P-type)
LVSRTHSDRPVIDAIKNCQSAGVYVRMVTGDN